MSAIARRLDKLEQALIPDVRPLLILTLCRAGADDDDLVSVGGVPFLREPGEPVETYKTRAVEWAKEHHTGDLPLILLCQYRRGGHE